MNDGHEGILGGEHVGQWLADDSRSTQYYHTFAYNIHLEEEWTGVGGRQEEWGEGF